MLGALPCIMGDLCRLYVLAEKFQDTAAKDATVDALHQAIKNFFVVRWDRSLIPGSVCTVSISCLYGTEERPSAVPCADSSWICTQSMVTKNRYKARKLGCQKSFYSTSR